MIIRPSSNLGTLNYHDQEMAKRIISNWKLTPATFAHKISRGSWIPATHLRLISTRIAAAIARGNGRIIVSAPPRHGKSQLCSINVPAWVLETYPQYKTILTGYGADLTTGFSRQVRDIFTDKDNEGLLSTRIRRDSSRVEAFLTEQGGGMYAVGLGGAITGRGAHVLLIDDYIKEIKEALSPAYRDYIWNWFVTTAYTRLEPGGTCIIIATRWHSDDLIGRLLATERHKWEYIEIPAIAEEDDILGREVGEALFPERYPIERLKELQETLGTIFFKALYQQKPVDESQKLADSRWFKHVKEVPDAEWADIRWCRAWDLAATEGGGDYTAGTLLGYNRKLNKTYIKNIIRDQMSPERVERKVTSTAMEDGADVKILIEQEPGASGKALTQHYQTNVLPEFSVEAYPAVNNKLVRAQPFLAHAEAGNVYLVEGPWVDAFTKEFDAFPGGENDDQVDTAAAAYQKLSGKRIFSASWGRNTKNSHTVNSNEHKRAQVQFATSSQRRTRVSGAVFGR